MAISRFHLMLDKLEELKEASDLMLHAPPGDSEMLLDDSQQIVLLAADIRGLTMEYLRVGS